MPVATAASRRAGERRDRFESLGEAFHQRVADGFRQMADADPDRWVVVDGRPAADEVGDRIWAEVRSRLGVPARG